MSIKVLQHWIRTKSFRSFGISECRRVLLLHSTFYFLQNGFKVIFWDGIEKEEEKRIKNLFHNYDIYFTN